MNQEETGLSVPVGQRQLFLDDCGLARVENLTRAMHQPRKLGAVIRPDLTLNNGAVQTRMAPLWDAQQQVFKLWTAGSTPNDLHAKGVYATTYFESGDGLHWASPAMNQVEYRGSKKNNLVLYEIDGTRCGISEAIYDPTDPDPNRRFKSFCSCAGGVGPIVSADGMSWRKLDIPPIPTGDENNFSFDQNTHLFILTVKRGGKRGGRAVSLSTSEDFEHWSEPELIFEADDLDQELGRKNIAARLADPTLQQPLWNDPGVYRVDVYNMGVFRYEGLYIGMPAMYHAVGPHPQGDNTTGFHLVQLICSRDLRTWQRLGDRKPFIGPSPVGGGAYDLQQIIGPSSPVAHGDELWFYYTGIKYRGEWPDADVSKHDLDPDAGAICLAVLRRDGFISLDAAEKGGTILTKPFRVTGGKLFVNADALKGELRVHALDGKRKVLATSAPVKGDRLRGEVQWQQGDIAHLKGQPVSLRFTVRNASFYSYWLEGHKLPPSGKTPR